MKVLILLDILSALYYNELRPVGIARFTSLLHAKRLMS